MELRMLIRIALLIREIILRLLLYSLDVPKSGWCCWAINGSNNLYRNAELGYMISSRSENTCLALKERWLNAVSRWFEQPKCWYLNLQEIQQQPRLGRKYQDDAMTLQPLLVTKSNPSVFAAQVLHWTQICWLFVVGDKDVVTTSAVRPVTTDSLKLSSCVISLQNCWVGKYCVGFSSCKVISCANCQLFEESSATN